MHFFCQKITFLKKKNLFYEGLCKEKKGNVLFWMTTYEGFLLKYYIYSKYMYFALERKKKGNFFFEKHTPTKWIESKHFSNATNKYLNVPKRGRK